MSTQNRTPEGDARFRRETRDLALFIGGTIATGVAIGAATGHAGEMIGHYPDGPKQPIERSGGHDNMPVTGATVGGTINRGDKTVRFGSHAKEAK